jgi:hypothetical protein
MKMIFLILLCAVIFTSCTVEKITSKKTYVCYETFPCGEIVVHRFINLTLTEGLQYKFDTVKCNPGDTIIIKKYRAKGLCGIFSRRLTTFTYYKNGNK